MKSVNNATTSDNLPAHIESILAVYPDWRAAVIKARKQRAWPSDKEPTTVEVYDQEGLLAGRLYSHAYSPMVSADRESVFQAWFYNGKLVFFYTQDEIVVNRLSA